MKKLIFVVFTILFTSNVFAQTGTGPARVYMVEGFIFRSPINFTRSSWIFALEEVEKHVKSAHPNAKFYELHNNDWFKVCTELKNLPINERPKQLIIIGHSYGAWASVQIANCIKEVQSVDKLITIDAVHKVALDENADIQLYAGKIPANVKKNINFFEDQDMFGLRGIKKNEALIPDCTEVNNVHVQVGLALSPHNQIVKILAETRKLADEIDEELRKEE